MANPKRVITSLPVFAMCFFLSHLTAGAPVEAAASAMTEATQKMGSPDDRAAAAFAAIVAVLRHPRCMNCHSNGDFPRQGDDSHRHTMQVRRGPDGQGLNAVKCSTCHQEHNVTGLHTPPGAPDWHLPPPAAPMIWQGLTDHQLCELLKDPKQNGHRSTGQIVEHMQTPLVLWGWHPGEGRTPIPMSQKRFLTYVKEWTSLGASCPSEVAASSQKR